MATKKKLLQAAAGTAAASGGAGALNVEDVFSTYLYEGNGSTQVIENGINLGQSNDGGSISLEAQADGLEIAQSSDFNFGTGDFTCEAWVWLNDSNTTYRTMFGFDVTGGLLFQVWNMQLDLGIRGTSSTVSNGSLSANQWNHLAVVRSSGTVYLFINGSLDRTATVDGASNSWSTINLSNSSNALIGDYSKSATNFNGRISNLRVSNTARYTATFTVPTSALSSDANTVLLIGQNDDPFADQSSSSHSATPYGSPSKSGFGPFDAADAGEGGLVWAKSRGTPDGHFLFDTERGAALRLKTDGTNAQSVQSTGLTDFNANGFSIGSNASMNGSGGNYASWTFRKAPKFFDVVTFTVGSAGTDTVINHNLGSNVGMVITKLTSTTSSWYVHHRGTANTNDYLSLNTTDAAASYGTVSLSDTQVNLGTFWSTNYAGQTGVAYIFAHNDGDGDFGSTADQDVIKCGSYTEPASGSQTINLGFEPQFILIKSASVVGQWQLLDTMRGLTDNQFTRLEPNSSGAESTLTSGYVYPLSTGFNAPSGFYGSGAEIIYIAIRRGPMAVPTDATDVFDVNTYANNSNSNIYDTGFNADMNINTDASANEDNYIIDRLRGGSYLKTNDSGPETPTAVTFWDDGNNILDLETSWWGTTSGVVSWSWKRAPSFCDVVAYTGNGTAGHTVSHNLGVAPEMMWVKGRNYVENWIVYHSAEGATKYLQLNTTGASSTSSSAWNNTAPTDTGFTVGTLNAVNESGYNYIAYLFASLDGVSKCGSFSHTSGSNTDVDCGFSNGARFVLIKRTDNIGHWITLDTERGIVTGNDAWLSLNLTSAENTSYDLIDPLSSGFTVDGSGLIGTGDYIFYAIA